MSRWKVARHIHRRTWLAYPAYYDSDQPHNDVDDDKPRTPRARAFRTWREALAYADRMARTREYVLPRPSSIQLATIAPAIEGDKPAFVFPHTPKGVSMVANGPFFIPYDQCGFIGRALLALAEKEGQA
ncbi:hypothetical protein [uncultured Corynebacterium sp.]|uniref:hypothetical protein n=1 Tax=uncultured Corynebacterium sp. TaxID=159447 RepID=UPI00259988F1|nr:hypothetical protein [uncultured Corynebacterium sp.]